MDSATNTEFIHEMRNLIVVADSKQTQKLLSVGVPWGMWPASHCDWFAKMINPLSHLSLTFLLQRKWHISSHLLRNVFTILCVDY